MKQVTIYTDGACSGNPGPGGWGAILMYGAHKRELSGGEADTTNNRMELTAVIRALSLLKEPCIVELWSDSKYVIDGLSKGWAKGWKAKGWVKSDKKPALNPDLWDELLRLEAEVSRLSQKKSAAAMEEKQLLDKLWENYELSHSAALEQRVVLESVSKATRRIAELNREIRTERQKLKLCHEIQNQVPVMEQDIQRTEEYQKEVREHEHRRR